MKAPFYHPCDWCGTVIKLNIKQDQARRLTGQTVFFCDNSHSAHWRWAQPGHTKKVVDTRARTHPARTRAEATCAFCGKLFRLGKKQDLCRIRDGQTAFFCGKSHALKWTWEHTDMRASVIATFGTDAGRKMMIKRAENNFRTAGKPGFFYIARFPGYLKFGSTREIKKRVWMLKRQHGIAPEMLVIAQVPDAGAYEALMLERFREHWIRGERFRDFLDGAEAEHPV